MSFYFNMDGEPIDVHTWAALFHDPARILARHESPKIITAWIGQDLRLGHFGADDPPHIFGTLLPDDDEWTYATREDALAGHARAIEKYRPG